MNSLFDSADLIPQPRYSELVKFKHFSGVAKAILSAREVLEKNARENERRANSEFWQNYGRKGQK